jgi:hypothetical protein
MTPEEIKNKSMRVLKAKEIEEVDQKVEKDMIELTILEAAENIEKYQKRPRHGEIRKWFERTSKLAIWYLKERRTGKIRENFMNPGKGHS